MTSVSLELFQVIASKESGNEAKLQQVQNLKSHVKKDLVDITQVGKYVEALSIAVDIPDLGISTISFSVLSHLVKRVSMQDKSGNVLKSQSFLVLPIIISRLGDSKASTRSSAQKALEAYWFSAPKHVEEAVADIALKHRNPSINLEAILWLDHIIINVNQHFKLTSFLPHLAQLLANAAKTTGGSESETVTALKNLFSDYFNLRHNRLYKYDLARELELHNIPSPIINSIMNGISGLSAESEKGFVQAGNVKVTAPPQNRVPSSSHAQPVKQQAELIDERPKSEPTAPNDITVSQVTENETASNFSTELQSIVAKAKYHIDHDIKPLDVRDTNHLYNLINDLLPVFNGRETEFNWSSRENSILKLRSIIRGNSSREFKYDLIASLKEASEAINKAISTLRTTLSSHGCHLIKECAIILQSDFDPLVELFLPSLIKLCSATKLIASTNANQSITAILVSCSYNHRTLQKVFNCSQEKNLQPRTYSGVWAQILLLRFHEHQSFLSAHNSLQSGVEVTSKIIQKLLGDPNPAARQVAKDAFWCFWGKFPTAAESILSKLEPNIVKGLERSRPLNKPGVSTLTPHTALAPKKPKPSIKESIIQRNKELKSKQRDFSASSRPSSRSSLNETNSVSSHNHGTTAETRTTNKFQRLGIPKRSISYSSNQNGSRSATPTERTHLNKNVEKTNAQDYESVHSSYLETNNTKIVHDSLSVPEAIFERTDAVSFDKKTDPILKFLSSNQTGLISEGINLLKYAILGEEDLSTDISSLLKKISIRDPHLLAPLFLSNENLFKRAFQFFAPEDFIRLCTILYDPLTDRNVDQIISVVAVDQIYDSITRLLSYTISTSNIDDDDELTIQVIRFKSSIIKTTVEFLIKGLDRIPISDSYFSKLTSNLIEMVSLLKSTEVYPSFTNLMIKLFAINPTLFVSELELVDESTREEVDVIVGIDRDHKRLGQSSTTTGNLGTLFDLTQVNHRVEINELSPVKLNTDFTMIVPIMKENNEFTYIPKVQDNQEVGVSQGSPRKGTSAVNINAEPLFDKEVDDNIDNEIDSGAMDIDGAKPENESTDSKIDNTLPDKDAAIENKASDEIQVNIITNELKAPSSHSSPSHDDRFQFSVPDRIFSGAQEEENIFVESSSEGRKSNLFKVDSGSDNSVELVDDFAQVTLTGELQSKDSIQKLIEKVDPLNSISSKKKQINIFEDSKGSPQKVREYNFSELNWFNFQVAKHSGSSVDENLEETQIENYQSICRTIGSNTVSGKEFISALNYLQALDSCDLNFHNYFESEGKELLETSLWEFFNNADYSSEPNVLSGIVLVKQMLVNRCVLSLNKLWATLCKLNKGSKINEELIHATEETFGEMISGLYETQDLFDCIVSSLSSAGEDKGVRSTIFVLASLSKLLDTSLFISNTLLNQIHQGIQLLINDKAVEVRRGVILNYSKLLKISRRSTSPNRTDAIGEKNLVENIIQKLPLPQQKLIEFYSQE